MPKPLQNASAPSNKRLSYRFSLDEGNGFLLDLDNGDPSGMAYAEGRSYVLDWRDAKAYAYRLDGRRIEDYDFETPAATNRNPNGLAFYEGKFYVGDWDRGSIYVYHLQRPDIMN